MSTNTAFFPPAGGSPTVGRPAMADRARGPRGHSLLPGGYGRSSLASVGQYSPVAVRGSGYRLWDEAGTEILDFHNNFTALIHGHGHPAIVKAASEALRDGVTFGLPNLSELQHARALLTRLDQLDQVRYTNSGTEAVALAVRVARAHTGRDICAFVQRSYHGWADLPTLAGAQTRPRGVPEGVAKDAVILSINDEQGFDDALRGREEQFAAVVLDFMPNKAGMTQLDPRFVGGIERACREHGIALIADEVVNLRTAPGGLHRAYGARPDLVAVGKLIGGGLPIGAVAGTIEWMNELDPFRAGAIDHGGTFSGSPIAMEAGLASLELFDDAALLRLNELGDAARTALAARLASLEWEARGRGSLMRFCPLGSGASSPLQQSLWREAYSRGVLITQQAMAVLSTPMTDTVISDFIEVIADSVAAVVAARASVS
jgi:glutamate-1-semialdehyde 2,1-aminomutase